MTSHWRDDGEYITLVVNVTDGYPADVHLSELMCNEQLLNYTSISGELSCQKLLTR